MGPQQVVPDYLDRCITNVLPTILDRPRAHDAPLADLRGALAGTNRVVLVLLDGLGDLQLDVRSSIAPFLSEHRLEPITTVAPSTTAAALTSVSTGVAPGVHGIVGYRFVLGPEILQALRWTVDGKDASSWQVPEQIQPVTPRLTRRGEPVPYVAKRLFEETAFTRAHLRGVAFRGVTDIDDMVPAVLGATQSHDVVVCYHDAIDKVAHATGLHDAYDAEIERADRFLVELREGLDDDVAIVVTADHGQVDAGSTAAPLSPRTLALVARMSGEGRFRWLHAFGGGAAELAQRALDELGESCWVVTKRQVLASGWLGDVSDAAEPRLGDVAILPFVDTYVSDPAEPNEARMRSRHGSLTAAEMVVPLVVG